MRNPKSFLARILRAACASLVLSGTATLHVLPTRAIAQEPAADTGQEESRCGCDRKGQRSSRPKFAEALPHAGQASANMSDEIAALSSMHHALATVGDGATYVWQRQNGRLSGFIKPTATFRNADRAVCRHLVVLLTTGEKTRKIEGVACREAGGVWSLEG